MGELSLVKLPSTSLKFEWKYSKHLKKPDYFVQGYMHQLNRHDENLFYLESNFEYFPLGKSFWKRLCKVMAIVSQGQWIKCEDCFGMWCVGCGSLWACSDVRAMHKWWAQLGDWHSMVRDCKERGLFRPSGPRITTGSDGAESLLTNGSTAFIWKLCCHWLRGLRHQITVVIVAVFFPTKRQFTYRS